MRVSSHIRSPARLRLGKYLVAKHRSFLSLHHLRPGTGRDAILHHFDLPIQSVPLPSLATSRPASAPPASPPAPAQSPPFARDPSLRPTRSPPTQSRTRVRGSSQQSPASVPDAAILRSRKRTAPAPTLKKRPSETSTRRWNSARPRSSTEDSR